MGVVYKALDPVIGRLVALKTLISAGITDPELLKRFYREAQAAGRLTHPNIVTIYDMGESDGRPYIAMEFLEGESLEKVISRREPVPIAQKLDIILQFCRGLGFAHKHNVVHRDVKPANIFIKSDGTVKVVDFGIVHIAATTMTHTGMVIGTVPYMSPEQVSGQHVDTRSDIFSVGTVAYEFLTYTKPFDGPNLPSIMFKIVNEKPVPPSQLVPDVPPQLENAIFRCFEQRPDDRYQALDDLVLELEPLEYQLKRQMVSQLVKQGQELYQAQDFARAKEVLRNVLLLDSGQEAAKELLAKVNTELRRIEVSARVDRLVGEAQQLLRQGKHSEASRNLEEAVRLDSQHGQAQRLLEEARRLAERDRRVQEALSSIHAALGKGDLTLAEAELSRVAELNAEHHEIQVLKERIEQARAREYRIKVQKAASFPRHLLIQERYEEAIRELERLRQEFPAEPEIEELYGSAQRKFEERQKRQQIESQIAEFQRLMTRQQFQEASAQLERLRAECAGQAEFSGLYDEARKRFEAAVREQRLERDLAAVQELIRQEQYAAALERAEMLRAQHPESVEAQQLVEFARSLKETTQQQQEVAAVSRSIQSSIEAGQLGEAIAEAERALQKFPDHRALVALLAAAREAQAREAQKAEQERLKQQINRQIGAVERVLAAKDYAAAARQAEELAKQYPNRSEVRRLLELVRAKLEAEQKQQVSAACQAVRALLEAGQPDRAVEEARNALHDFPGNADLTALWMEAKKQQREPAAVRGEQARDSELDAASATMLLRGSTSEVAGAPAFAIPPARGVERAAAATAKPRARPVAPPVWRRPASLVIAAALLAVGIVAAVHFTFRPVRPTAEEIQLANLAQQFRQQGRLGAALDTLAQLQALHGAMESQAKTQMAQIEQARRQEDEWFQQAEAAQNQKQWDKAIRLYTEIINLNGERKQQAIANLQDVQSVENTIQTAGSNQQQVEAAAFQHGEDWYRQKNYDQAQRELQKVVMLNLPGSRLVPKAQALLEEIHRALQANAQKAEQLYNEASRLSESNDVNVLAKAVGEFQQVVTLHTSWSEQAQAKLRDTNNRITALVSQANNQKQRQQALNNTVQSIQADLSQRRYGDALALLANVRQLGGDTAGIQSQITSAYQTEFKKLEASYNQAKAGKDLTALVEVATNLGDLKARAGTLGGDLPGLTDQVQATIKELSTRPAVPNPSPIAAGSPGGPAARAEAQPRVSWDLGGAVQKYPGRVDKGMVLPAFYVDSGLRPAGGQLTMPPVAGAASGCFVTYIIRIDTSGSVHPDHALDDKCGLGSAVEQAAQKWKFNPPTAKGKPVQTSVTVKVEF
jgi:tetratricopeptide (TPR) repeat protein